ncbi:MAG TPA: amidohydrolase [Actinomycetes bacterium]|nr:amidohydrolase [Actinomycetes bacterium]
MTADLVFTGGSIFAGRGGPPRRGAVAVSNGRIERVGDDDTVRELVGKTTEVIDIGDGLLVPGFIDSHVHPVYAGTAMMVCDLHGTVSEADCVAAVAAYATANPNAEWILGGGWAMAGFAGGLPTRQALDAVVPDRPVFLPNRDGHGAWVNTKALELAGIDANTPDPADGRIEREPDGTPSGALHEGAMSAVSDLIPAPTAETYDRALDVAQEYLFSLGITGWQDAIIGDVNGRPDNLDAYLRAANDGRLKVRVVGALWWDRLRGPEQIDAMLERRANGKAGRFAATSVKIMQDGVAENFTAAMLNPYLDACGDHTANSGISFVDPKALNDDVVALDAHGFQVHFHAIGDRAVREALDAIEAARVANGDSDLRHHIAHIQLVHPDDVPRFAQLGVTANMQPLWACHEPQMDELTIPFLGEPRWRTQYPFGSLARSGAHLSGGSDWSVSTPDVLFGSHVAVNRVAPPEEGDAATDPFLPDERIDLATALTAYTHGSAYVNHLDDVSGSIESGKFADLALLDRNPFAGATDQIYAARVAATWVEGEQVFGQR